MDEPIDAIITLPRFSAAAACRERCLRRTCQAAARRRRKAARSLDASGSPASLSHSACSWSASHWRLSSPTAIE